MATQQRSTTIRVPTARAKLLKAMAVMPEEAFGYLLKVPLVDFPQLAANGGFRPESRESFKKVAQAAEEYAGS